MEVDADSELSAASKASFLDKVRQSNQACQSGDFETAVGLYGEAIALDPCNHILFSNRSAALVKLGHFARALQDASRAVELNAKWPKVSPVQSRPASIRLFPSRMDVALSSVPRSFLCVCFPSWYHVPNG